MLTKGSMGITICVVLLIYAWMKISSLQETIGELNTELIATKANLQDAEASYKSAMETANYHAKVITDTKGLLRKCNMDLRKTLASYQEIENIMKAKSPVDAPDATIPSDFKVAPVPTVTDYQSARGMQFMNSQLSRLGELKE